MLLTALLLAPLDVQAAEWPPRIRRTTIVMTRTVTTKMELRFRAAMPPSDVATAEVELTSADGDETVTLKPDDFQLHGAVALDATGPAALTVTTYDTGAKAIGGWSGKIDEQGRVSLAAELGKTAIASTGAAKGDDGVVLPLVWTGADADQIASATVDVVTYEVVEVCEGKVCTSEAVAVVTSYEVDLDELDQWWVGDTTLAGPVDAKVIAYDARGKKLGAVKAVVGDDGAALDDDPATWVTLGDYAGAPALTVVSAGWTADDEVASVDLGDLVDGAATVQRQTVGTSAKWKDEDFIRGETNAVVQITIDGGSFRAADQSKFSMSELSEPVCGPSWCVARAGDSATSFDVWAYGDSDAALPTSVKLGLSYTIGDKTYTGSDVVALADEHVFTATLEVAAWGDVAAAPVAGKVKLKGPADAKGKAETLVKGRVNGVVVEDGDGWALAATAKSDVPDADRGGLIGVGAPAVLGKAGPGALCGKARGMCRTNLARVYSAPGS